MKNTLGAQKFDPQQNQLQGVLDPSSKNSDLRPLNKASTSDKPQTSFQDLLSAKPAAAPSVPKVENKKLEAPTQRPTVDAKTTIKPDTKPDTKPDVKGDSQPVVKNAGEQPAQPKVANATEPAAGPATKSQQPQTPTTPIASHDPIDNVSGTPAKVDKDATSEDLLPSAIDIPVKIPTDAVTTPPLLAAKPDDVNLQILSEALGKRGSEALLNQNPILSFVTGKLEKLDVNSIPKIVSGNAFLKNALSAADITKFFATPKAIDQLFQDFEIDPNLIKKSSNLGLDLTDQVSPKDFLKALGLDPSRAQNELDLLSQKLPLEGLSSVMKRAQALSKPTTSPKQGKLESVGLLEDQTLQDQTDDSKKLDINQQLLTAHLAGQQQMPKPIESPKTVETDKPAPTKDSNLRAVDNTKAPAAPQNVLQNLVLPNLTGDISTPKMSMEPKDVITGSAVPKISPKAAMTSIAEDPFEMIAKDRSWNIGSVTTAKGSLPLATNISVEEQLSAATIRDGWKLEALKPKEAEIQIKPSATPIVALDTGMSMLKTDNAPSLAKLDLNMQTQAIDPNISKETAFKSGSESFSQNSDDKDKKDSTSKDIPLNRIEAKFHHTDALKMRDGFDPTPAEIKAPDMKKIMDHTQSLAKAGGGSMRLDLQDTNLGKLDLAVRVSQGQVELRILTDRKDSRDILNAELPKLRDSLLSQGLSLKTVEVSVGDRNTWSQSFSQRNPQQQQDGGREFLATVAREARGTALNRVAPVASNFVPRSAMAPSLGEGRISVRI